MTVQTQRPVIAPPPTVLEGDASLFRNRFNRATFSFAHHLCGHPLFELPRLLELSKKLPEADAYYDAGNIRIDQRWDQTPRTALSVDQLIDRIENAGAWILLKRANRFPEYAAILDQALAEVQALVGPAFPNRMRMRSAVVLITSPNRTTAYHIDPDCNFLCQISGSKTLHVFDRYDREVLPEEEIERFWAVDKNAAVYKSQYQGRATSYEFTPGLGVHLPVNAPHWVQNDTNISVTLAIIFQFPESVLGNIYRCNHYLRKAGVKPQPPGRSPVRDRVKSLTMSGGIAIRNLVRKFVKQS
jgi:hypothetical protein